MSDSSSSSSSDSENEDDKRMKALLADWDDDSDDSDDSSDDSDDDDEDEKEAPPSATKKDLNLQDNDLDHIVIAAPDFDEALKEFENMTGIKPSVVGSLRGLGTKSARVGLDKNAYIEIVAPDPKNSGPIGAALARDLEEGTLIPYHYAIRSSEVEEMKDNYVPNELGWHPDHISMFGAAADGIPKKWEMLYMYGHKIGGCVPFYIDWGECDHPSATIPEVGSLKSLIVRAPAGHKVHELLSAVSGIIIEEGEPMLEFAFGSPEGTITFSADNPTGIKFPGYEEGDTGSAPASAKAKSAAKPKKKAEASDSDDSSVEISDQDSDSSSSSSSDSDSDSS